jgi:NTP pyrophosphatase (non-canonical NTP hydrolase)
MDFKGYEELALRTKGFYTDKFAQALNGAMGLAGEAGEVIDVFKKAMFQGHELPREKLIEEVGDIMWYIPLIAQALGTSMEEIAIQNIEKLKKRYPEGFEKEKSINRTI